MDATMLAVFGIIVVALAALGTARVRSRMFGEWFINPRDED
jgi:hypothetical protein